MSGKRPTHSRNTGLERGKGWVDELPSGRWRARVHRQPGGSLGTFATHAEAVDALRHAVPIEDHGTISEHLDRYLELGASRWQMRTLRNYEGYVGNKIAPYIGHLAWHELDQRTLDAWWTSMSSDTGRTIRGQATSGRTTTAKVWRFFRQVLDRADQDGLLTHRFREPVPNAGRETAPERHLLTERQVQKILEHVPANRQILVVLSAVAGLRFGEIVALQVGDIDLDTLVVAVRRAVVEDPSTGRLVVKDTKSGAGRRRISIHPQVGALVASHIAEHILNPDDATYLIATSTGAPLRNTNWSRLFRRAVTAAGLDHLTPPVTTHDLRHHAVTAAALRADSHRDLMAFAGHSSPSASHRYIHAARQDLSHLARPFPAGPTSVADTA